jgi:hypothetical protein
MSYKTERLNLTAQPIAGTREFIYTDTGSTVASIQAAGFFSDGKAKGMRVGDVVEFRIMVSPWEGGDFNVIEIQATDTGTQYATVKALDTD